MTREGAIRTSIRARVLTALEKLQLTASAITVRRVTPEQLRDQDVLRGAAALHVDLLFRTSLTTEQLVFTATRGWMGAGFHPSLPDFPIGIALALPYSGEVENKAQLFEPNIPTLSQAESLVLYSLATNPARIGAGRALVAALREFARELASSPPVVAFSPLTGLRAQVIRIVDEPIEWAKICDELDEVTCRRLREQLLSLFTVNAAPPSIDEPARSWLANKAQEFASSERYRAGAFHKQNGARFIGLAERGDVDDGESMWMRTRYQYD